MTDSDMNRDQEVANPSGAKIPKIYLQDLAEKPVKILTLPTFPLDRQLTGSNYGIWKMIMLAVLDSYELSIFIMHDFPKPEDDKEGALWDRINARIR